MRLRDTLCGYNSHGVIFVSVKYGDCSIFLLISRLARNRTTKDKCLVLDRKNVNLHVIDNELMCLFCGIQNTDWLKWDHHFPSDLAWGSIWYGEQAQESDQSHQQSGLRWVHPWRQRFNSDKSACIEPFSLLDVLVMILHKVSVWRRLIISIIKLVTKLRLKGTD